MPRPGGSTDLKIDQGAPARRRIRQHWIALLSPSTCVFVAVALALVWLHAKIPSLAVEFHIYRGTPASTLATAVYAYTPLLTLGCVATAACCLLASWYTWSISYVEITPTSIIYRIGLFTADEIPFGAIQRLHATRSIGGLIFGYGTLVILAGQLEQLPRLPHITQLLAEIRPRQYVYLEGR